MKKNKFGFLLAEIVLLLAAIFCIHKIFAEGEPQQRVAVIVPSSGQSGWDAMINGMKDAATQENIHMVICNTDEIPSASDQKALIEEQMENDIDAFIICPAQGDDTAEMLSDTLGEIPYILVTEETYGESESPKKAACVSCDNYRLGSDIAAKLLEDIGEEKDVSVGIVAAKEKTEGAAMRMQGACDMLVNEGISPAWHFYQSDEADVCNQVYVRMPVDYIISLDSVMLDTLGENAQGETLHGAMIYGVGSSKESISLLDQGKVQALVVPDGYGIGYESVKQIAAKLENAGYTMENVTVSQQILSKEDVFTKDLERYLYAYE